MKRRTLPRLWALGIGIAVAACGGGATAGTATLPDASAASDFALPNAVFLAGDSLLLGERFTLDDVRRLLGQATELDDGWSDRTAGICYVLRVRDLGTPVFFVARATAAFSYPDLTGFSVSRRVPWGWSKRSCDGAVELDTPPIVAPLALGQPRDGVAAALRVVIPVGATEYLVRTSGLRTLSARELAARGLSVPHQFEFGYELRLFFENDSLAEIGVWYLLASGAPVDTMKN